MLKQYSEPALRNKHSIRLDNKLLEHILLNSAETEAPFYIYDIQQIRQQCDLFLKIPYKPKSIHFATMANINQEFLKVVKTCGLSVFVNSILHLKAVQNAGFSSDQIVFTASAMTESTMQYVRQHGIQVNLDSRNQLEKWMHLFPGTPVGIRCNIGELVNAKESHAGYFIGNESRLGLSPIEIRLLKGNSVIEGLHLYVGTNIMDIDYFIQCYSVLVQMSAFFPNLRYLNFGGGFGISENGDIPFSMEEYGFRVTELMLQVSRHLGTPLKLYLEPGRIIGGKSGYFICRVSDVKPRKNQTFVGVSASTVQFPRPLFYPDYALHPVMIIRDGRIVNSAPTQDTSIYGCSTYSRDYFLRHVTLPKIALNDLLIFGNAGSYCASGVTEFLGFEKPQEIFV